MTYIKSTRVFRNFEHGQQNKKCKCHLWRVTGKSFALNKFLQKKIMTFHYMLTELR